MSHCPFQCFKLRQLKSLQGNVQIHMSQNMTYEFITLKQNAMVFSY